jgi:4-hydroxybenzoate polyprenyltransferase
MTPLKRYTWYNVIFIPTAFIVCLFLWVFFGIDIDFTLLLVLIVCFLWNFILKTASSRIELASDEMEEVIYSKAQKTVRYALGFYFVVMILIAFIFFKLKGMKAVEVSLLWHSFTAIVCVFWPFYLLVESVAVLVIYRRQAGIDEKGNQFPLSDLHRNQPRGAK